MAYTQQDIDDLKAAIASGARIVEYSDRKVEYRSLNDMQRTLEMMQFEVNPQGIVSSGKSAIGSRRIAVSDKGLV